MADTSLDRVLRSKAGNKEPLLMFRWVCTEIPFGLPTEYVEEAQITWVNLEVKEGKFGASTFSYYPGFSDIDQFSLVITEDSKGTASRWIMNWLNRIKDFGTGNYSLPTRYKRNMSFQLLDTRGIAVMDVQMINVWPITRDAFGLNYTDKEGRHQLNVTFSVDDQNIVFHAPQPDTFERTVAPSLTSRQVPEVNGQLPIAGQGAPNVSIGAAIAGDQSPADVVGQAATSVSNGLTVNNAIPDQNPVPPVVDAFETVVLPAQTTEDPPKKTFFDKLVGSVRASSSSAANRFSTALKGNVGKAIDSIEPSDLADSQSRRNWINNVKGNLRETGNNQTTAYAANVVGAAARTSFDNLVDKEKQGATEQELADQKQKDTGFWSKVMDSATKAGKDFTDKAIEAAETADPDDSRFPENVRQDVDTAVNDNQRIVTKDVVEAAKTSGKEQYSDWKTDYEEWRETRTNDTNLDKHDAQGLSNDFE